MSNTTASPTLKSLIEQKIHQKQITPSDLVSAIGYTNTTKGIRRLSRFSNTLEAPSDSFVLKLLSVLEIDVISFNKAINASLEQFNADSQRSFKPYIEILLSVQIRPVFAAQIVGNKCSTPVPIEIQNQPLQDEIEAVIAIYKNRVDTVLSSNILKHAKGFHYYREHNCYLVFDSDFTLVEKVTVKPMPFKKVPLGNRVVDLISGGMG